MKKKVEMLVGLEVEDGARTCRLGKGKPWEMKGKRT